MEERLVLERCSHAVLELLKNVVSWKDMAPLRFLNRKERLWFNERVTSLHLPIKYGDRYDLRRFLNLLILRVDVIDPLHIDLPDVVVNDTVVPRDNNVDWALSERKRQSRMLDSISHVAVRTRITNGLSCSIVPPPSVRVMALQIGGNAPNWTDSAATEIMRGMFHVVLYSKS